MSIFDWLSIVGVMRPEFVAQKRRETPASLAEFAAELEAAARSLRGTAERMLIKGVSHIEVRYSPGAHVQLVKSIKPFVLDAEKKASILGA